MELLKDLWPVVSNLIASGVGVSIILAVIAWIIPNDKLYSFGFGIGQSLSKMAVLRFGIVWERIEDFTVNSIGMILSGLKSGLNSDDVSTPHADIESDSREA